MILDASRPGIAVGNHLPSVFVASAANLLKSLMIASMAAGIQVNGSSPNGELIPQNGEASTVSVSSGLLVSLKFCGNRSICTGMIQSLRAWWWCRRYRQHGHRELRVGVVVIESRCQTGIYDVDVQCPRGPGVVGDHLGQCVVR